jgi:hypothetical protein
MVANPPHRLWDPASMHRQISAAAAVVADKDIAAAQLTQRGPAVVAPSVLHGANLLAAAVALVVEEEEEEEEKAAACRP